MCTYKAIDMIEFTFNNGLVTFKCTIDISKVKEIISCITNFETNIDKEDGQIDEADEQILFFA